MTDPSALHGEVVRHLQAAHSLKAGALRMTGQLARDCRAEDEEMAATINRNWVNVLSLTVAIHLWRELRVDHDTWQEEGVLHIRPRGVLWFGAAQILEGIVLTELARHPDARGLRLHLDGIGRLDITAALTLRSVMDEARRGGMDVGLTGVEERDRRLVDGVVRDVPARRHP